MKKANRRHKSSLTKRTTTADPDGVSPFDEVAPAESDELTQGGVEQVDEGQAGSIESAATAQPLAGVPSFVEPALGRPEQADTPPYLVEK